MFGCGFFEDVLIVTVCWISGLLSTPVGATQCVSKSDECDDVPMLIQIPNVKIGGSDRTLSPESAAAYHLTHAVMPRGAVVVHRGMAFLGLGNRFDFPDLALPVISSVDNFVLGAALGLGGNRLPFFTVSIVAVANAAGMLLSSFVGEAAGAWAPTAANIVAGLFFLVIGGLELRSWWGKNESLAGTLANIASTQSAWVLALSMTLNNFASGLAGGMVARSIWILSLLTLIASFVLMYIGYFLGKFTSYKAFATETSLAVGVVFVVMGLIQFSHAVASQC